MQILAVFGKNVYRLLIGLIERKKRGVQTPLKGWFKALRKWSRRLGLLTALLASASSYPNAVQENKRRKLAGAPILNPQECHLRSGGIGRSKRVAIGASSKHIEFFRTNNRKPLANDRTSATVHVKGIPHSWNCWT